MANTIDLDLDIELSIDTEYERFVWLCREYPGQPLVPSVAVDLHWHASLEAGDPTAPLHVAGLENDPRIDIGFAATLSLYRSHFGEPGSAWAVGAECQVESPPPPFVAA